MSVKPESKKEKKEIPQAYPQGCGIEWLSNRSFRLGGHDFNIPSSFADFVALAKEIDKETFYIAKTPNLISRYINRFAKRRLRNILELGVFRGGSAAFLQLIAKPERLLAVELSPVRMEILDRFIATEGLERSLVVEYGVDQSNATLVRKLATEHLGSGRSIDLVIDDASHLLAPTRTSFETLFPLLRPGGLYIIEDYANMHILASEYLDHALEGAAPAQKLVTAGVKGGLQADRKPCHLLAVEAMLASIVVPGLIRRVVVDRHWLEIERGGDDFDDPNSFDLKALAADQFSLLESAPSQRLSGFLS
jgi:predicted O-methyltransferase YrrM